MIRYKENNLIFYHKNLFTKCLAHKLDFYTDENCKKAYHKKRLYIKLYKELSRKDIIILNI